MTNTSAKGTTYYMSPELLLISTGLGIGEFDPELSDIFSLGISFLRIILQLEEYKIWGLNNQGKE